MNSNRIQQVLHWNIMAYKSQLWRFFLRAVAVFGIFVVINNFGSWIAQSVSPDSVAQAAHISVVALVVLVVWSASCVCFNSKTRTEFISYAMLPATKCEKFLTNIIYQTVIVLGLSFLGLVAVDIVQALISLIVAQDAYSVTFAALQYMANPFRGGVMNGLIAYAVLILFHSIYVLGGTFFRKHQFLYTTLAHMAIGFILSMLVGALLCGVAYFTYNQGYNIHVEWIVDEVWLDIITFVVILLVSAGFYRLAFRYYKRMQVINNKYFN